MTEPPTNAIEQCIRFAYGKDQHAGKAVVQLDELTFQLSALVADNKVKDARIAELEAVIDKVDTAIGLGYEPQIVRTKT